MDTWRGGWCTGSSAILEEQHSRFSRRARGDDVLKRGPSLGAQHYWHPEILKDASLVLQLNVPLDFRYSVVYQKVQSSTGSIAMLE